MAERLAAHGHKALCCVTNFGVAAGAPLTDGAVGPYMASPTIIDIAREAGVAFKTVARVINREPLVKKETREKVEAVIERLGYKPNVWARSLRSSRSHLIAMIYTPTEGTDARSRSIGRKENLSVSTYYNQIHVAAMTKCQNAGYHLFIEELGTGHRATAKRIRDLVAATKIDGVLLTPPLSDNLVVMKALRAENVPFVRVSPYTHLDMSSYVYIDDHKAAYEMTRYLCGLGHRDIAFIKGPPDHESCKARRRGFEEAIKEYKANIRPEWLVEDAFSMRLGAIAAEKLISGRHRPTAVFAFNDDIAAGVMSGAYRRGLVLPRDLSIVGFDDAPIASALWPGLTTVYQPVAELAQAATELLINEIELSAKFVARELDHEIVVRESTAAPGPKTSHGRGNARADA